MKLNRLFVILGLPWFLTNCGAAVPRAAPLAGRSFRPTVVQPASHGVSWMGKGVKQQDLLYVSNGDGVVNVYRYWQHTLVGVLSHFTNPMGECTDAAGDVYVVDEQAEKIYEYGHGGTKPIKALDDAPQAPISCAVNQATGDLAVANYSEDYDSYRTGNIVVYPHGSGKPIVYQGKNLDHFVSCAYDRRGDLFTTSSQGYGSYYYVDFYYLPRHGTSLIPMTLRGPSQSFQWFDVVSVGWDGKYWVVAQLDDLYRYIINVKAYYASTVTLSGGYGVVNQFAFYHPLIRSHGMQVVGAAENGSVDYWNYPAGGSDVAQITKGLDNPYGVAISLGTP